MSSTLLPNRTPVFSSADPEPVSLPNLDDDVVHEDIWEETAADGMLASLREAPAWAVSLVVHLVILLLLGSLTQVTQMMLSEEIVATPVEELDEMETYKFDTTVQDDLGNDSNMDKMSPSQQVATLAGADIPQEIERRLTEDQIELDVPTFEDLAEPSRSDLTEVFETRGATEHPGGVEGAMDRMAFEIANATKKEKALVVWLFDASLSLKERRDAIADRFANIYEQVGLQGVGEGDMLLTAAVTFGEKTTFLTNEPTSDVGPLTEKIREIPADESGKELVFTALEDVYKKWGKYRTSDKRNVMFIIVTDERGDDFAKMEGAIHSLSRVGIRVHCIGNAAVFGKEKGYVSYTWKEGDLEFQEDLPVDQGPETHFPELLDLDFWGLSNKRRLNNLSSSYGPYPLNRLCAETGGLYLVAGESSRAELYDYGVMRNYQPDYRPINELTREIQSNKAKAALVGSAQAMRLDRINMPNLSFDASTDNVLRNEILEAQKPISVLDYKIDQLLLLMQEGEKDRDKISEPRWRAAFDLAMGRVLAMKVRSFGYNQMLAEMRTGIKPFEKPESNMWFLVPSKDMKSATPSVRKMAQKAEDYLRRVIDEHPGTPWATLAEAEYAQAMGWTWEEAFIPKDGNMAMRNNNPDLPQLLFADEVNRRRMQNQPRPTPKNRPKL